MRLSIIVPVFNEERTVLRLLERIHNVPLPGLAVEVIVVDDGSRDRTCEALRSKTELYSKLIVHPRNLGKGAAVRTGLEVASGDLVIVQDADEEYSPAEYPALLAPLLENEADVVFGARTCKSRWDKLTNMAWMGRRLLSWLTRLLSGWPVSDVATCYKAFRREDVLSVDLREKGFGFDPELTFMLASGKDRRFKEIPISYTPRSRAEGKKLRLWHGWPYLWAIVRHGGRCLLRRLCRG